MNETFITQNCETKTETTKFVSVLIAKQIRLNESEPIAKNSAVADFRIIFGKKQQKLEAIKRYAKSILISFDNFAWKLQRIRFGRLFRFGKLVSDRCKGVIFRLKRNYNLSPYVLYKAQKCSLRITC